MQIKLTGFQTERIKYLQQSNKRSIQEIADMHPNKQRDQELLISHKTKKGAFGQWAEWFITDQKPNSKRECDISEVDIKTITVGRGRKNHLQCGLTPKENLRITDCNYNTIQNEPYSESGLKCKSKMLVLMTKEPRKGCLLYQRIFQGIGVIDLSSPSIQQILKEDYETIRQLAAKGEAHTISSRAIETRTGRVQPGRIVKTYSHSGPKVYQDQHGNDCNIKTPVSFYLFKAQIAEYLKPLPSIND